MPKKTKSLEEIAQKYEAMIDDESQDEAFTSVSARINPDGESVYVTRFSRQEIDPIYHATKDRNIAVTEFIRAAALAAAAGELDLSAADTVKALHDAQAKAQDLAEALKRI
jgi:hypothetical protein